MAAQVLADVRLPRAVVRELDAEPDRHALGTPALGRVTDLALALLVGGVRVGGLTGLEVEVVRDGDLGDTAFDRLAGVLVDVGRRIGRQVRVQVCVEREVARLSIGGHRAGSRFNPR